ncbi:unnamed protein product [Rotaria sp. Silwood1]|nr:unnamed protein product [Rotaria sp. Silwood1]
MFTSWYHCLVGKIDGDYQFDDRKTALVLTLPIINQSNSKGVFEFPIQGTSADLFPIQVDFVAKTSYCDIKVMPKRKIERPHYFY